VIDGINGKVLSLKPYSCCLKMSKKSSVYQSDLAECGELGGLLRLLSGDIDSYLDFDSSDAMSRVDQWQGALNRGLPELGIGMSGLLEELGQYVLPNGSAVPKPGCSSFINTGASSAAVLANLSASVASPQRYGLTAFNYLEELSLSWLVEMFELPKNMAGVYSSGGSTANIIGLGGARQVAFERLGIDPAVDGVQLPCRIYASADCHRTIHRAAAVLGLGRASVVAIDVDSSGRIKPEALSKLLLDHANDDSVPVAIVANAGSTDTGAIDPLEEIGEIARQYKIWFHVDGAYGLPGILDPKCKPLYGGLKYANSVCVDPHKWLGAQVGIGATFVRDRSILQRAFTQGSANYLEGAFSDEEAQNSMDSFGVPYDDYGLELSAPCRGIVVWALIREIGKEGLAQRVMRHNAMAGHVAQRAKDHRNLELALEPILSICCFRYVDKRVGDLDDLNRKIHRHLVRNGINIPSTTVVNGALVIRPCFIGARAVWHHADDIVDEVLEIGGDLVRQFLD
jgi:aromatic-L-amino-acid/L-tryptophan decarboxylase